MDQPTLTLIILINLTLYQGEARRQTVNKAHSILEQKRQDFFRKKNEKHQKWLEYEATVLKDQRDQKEAQKRAEKEKRKRIFEMAQQLQEER